LNYLNEKQMRCIEMMIEDSMEITKIAKELGVSRTTIYNWMKDERFKAELDKNEQDIKTRVNRVIVHRLPEAIEKLWALTNSTDGRTKLKATKEWVDRGLGKVSTSMTIEDKRSNSDVGSIDELMTMADELIKQEEKQAEND